MKFSSVVALLLLVTQAASASQPADEEARIALLARLEKTVVVIRASSSELLGPETLGSGVIASSDGLVFTAAHVVSDARSLEISLKNGQTSDAKILYLDEMLDLALLRMSQPPPADAVAVLGDSDTVRKGATVYVIGNPRGLEFSIATGIVSARHSPQHAGIAKRLTEDGSSDGEWIQTDAAMNAGVSGGPMFNSRGEVIGIAQSIVSRSGGSEGLGFGISINSVKKILKLDPCLYLGFSAVPLKGSVARAFNVATGAGLLVQFVAPSSPAAEAGLQGGDLEIGDGRERIVIGGDIITHVDGVPVEEWRRQSFAGANEGDRHEMKLRVLRGGDVIELVLVTVHRARW